MGRHGATYASSTEQMEKWLSNIFVSPYIRILTFFQKLFFLRCRIFSRGLCFFDIRRLRFFHGRSRFIFFWNIFSWFCDKDISLHMNNMTIDMIEYRSLFWVINDQSTTAADMSTLFTYQPRYCIPASIFALSSYSFQTSFSADVLRTKQHELIFVANIDTKKSPIAPTTRFLSVCWFG